MNNPNKKRGFSVAQVRQWGGRLLERSQGLLLYHNKALTGSLFVLAVLVSVGVAAYFIFLPPGPGNLEAETVRRDLDSATFDELELWIEQRQTAYENPPQLPAGVFVR